MLRVSGEGRFDIADRARLAKLLHAEGAQRHVLLLRIFRDNAGIADHVAGHGNQHVIAARGAVMNISRIRGGTGWLLTYDLLGIKPGAGVIILRVQRIADRAALGAVAPPYGMQCSLR